MSMSGLPEYWADKLLHKIRTDIIMNDCNNDQMAALREAVELIADIVKVHGRTHARTYAAIETVMQLITTTTAEAVREARIDETTKSTIAIEARLDAHLNQSNSFTAQEVIGAYRKNRIAHIEAENAE